MESERKPPPTPDVERTRRSRLVRDLLVFQGKLLLDAFKDVLLGPLTLITALIGLVQPRPRSRLLFYRVLEQGKAAERVIDLFSAVEPRGVAETQWTVDTIIEEVEQRLAGTRSTARKGVSGSRDEVDPQGPTTGREEDG
jgi:hypothetical protein